MLGLIIFLLLIAQFCLGCIHYLRLRRERSRATRHIANILLCVGLEAGLAAASGTLFRFGYIDRLSSTYLSGLGVFLVVLTLFALLLEMVGIIPVKPPGIRGCAERLRRWLKWR